MTATEEVRGRMVSRLGSAGIALMPVTKGGVGSKEEEEDDDDDLVLEFTLTGRSGFTTSVVVE
jgi:hypothetical protein